MDRQVALCVHEFIYSFIYLEYAVLLHLPDIFVSVLQLEYYLHLLLEYSIKANPRHGNWDKESRIFLWLTSGHTFGTQILIQIIQPSSHVSFH